MKNSSKKAIVITGCSSGIGQSAAIMLHKRGYRVIATVRKEEDKTPLLNAGITASDILLLELANEESVNNCANAVIKMTAGKLYGLFNNAAYGQPGAVEDLSRAVLRQQFDVNVFGTHQLTIQLLPSMLAMDDARIIQNSSVLGFVAMPMRGAYNAAKFALEGLTDTLRLELKGSPVKISLIEPGPIASAFRKNALSALKQNIDTDNSRHALAYGEALERLEKPGPAVPFTLGPEAVVEKLIHALESKRPRARYRVTFPTYLMAALKVVLPVGLMDAVLRKAG